jgi:hypothetical protein
VGREACDGHGAARSGPRSGRPPFLGNGPLPQGWRFAPHPGRHRGRRLGARCDSGPASAARAVAREAARVLRVPPARPRARHRDPTRAAWCSPILTKARSAHLFYATHPRRPPVPPFVDCVEHRTTIMGAAVAGTILDPKSRRPKPFGTFAEALRTAYKASLCSGPPTIPSDRVLHHRMGRDLHDRDGYVRGVARQALSGTPYRDVE